MINELTNQASWPLFLIYNFPICIINCQSLKIPQTKNKARIVLALQAYHNSSKLSIQRAAKIYEVN